MHEGRERWQVSSLVALAVGAGACLLGACFGPPKGARPTSTRGTPSSATICAFGLPGVRTAVSDTEDGVAVSLSVMGDPARLQRRVHDVLENRQSYPGEWQPDPDSQKLVRELKIQIIDEPTGIALFATPVDPSSLATIRSKIRARLEQGRVRACE